jgi:hypothetical protein
MDKKFQLKPDTATMAKGISSRVWIWSSLIPPPCASREVLGETLREQGYSKDHRPDLNQMVVGAVQISSL